MSERDELSIFLMDQDGRITYLAGRANSAELRLDEVKYIVTDDDLTAKAKIARLREVLGMNVTNRRPNPERLADLLAGIDLTEDDFE